MNEFDALISGKRPPPERIYGWLDTQMSIARYYGGLTYQGYSYAIAVNEEGHPLVRYDVLIREAKKRKDAKERKTKAQFDRELAK